MHAQIAKKHRHLVLPQVIWLLLPATVYAAESKAPQWYEITTGILAIPAAIIGLAYSFILIRKTRHEVKKTELEILEKQKQFRQALKAQPVEKCYRMWDWEIKRLLRCKI